MNSYKYLLLIFILIAGISIKAQVVQTWNNQSIGYYTITKPGTYQISGTVTGNITVAPTSAGDVTITGITADATLQGISWPSGTARSVSHYSGNCKSGTLTWTNLTVKGNGHNAMEGHGTTPKIFSKLHVINYARTVNGISYPGVGGINGGQNSTITNCYLETGDDAAKITYANSACYNTRIRMTNNGSAIQFGWNNVFQGAGHYADSVQIRGMVIPNVKNQTNQSTDPGRCIIGGVLQNNASDVRLTNLDINVTNYKHLIYLWANDNSKNSPLLNNVLIQGTITDSSIFNTPGSVEEMKCVAISSSGSASIKNVVIDLGDKIADTMYHYISGNTDVTFIYCNGSKKVQYVNGKLVRYDGKCTVSQLPAVSFQSPTDTLFPAGSDVDVLVNASDPNGTISLVKLYVNGHLLARQLTSPPYEWGSPTNNYDARLRNMKPGTYHLETIAYNSSGDSTIATLGLTISDVITATTDPTTNAGKIVAYPNPADQWIYLKNTTEDISWQLFNSQGKRILSGTGKTIPIGNLIQGIYHLKADNQVLKILKE